MTNSKTVAICLLAAGACGWSAVADAKDAGDFMVRVRGIAVAPDESGSTDVLGGKIKVSTAYAPEIDFTYFITPNIAAELIAATSRHDLKLKNSAAGRSLNLGSVWVLPPTLTLQYHFFSQEIVSPYIGVGVNYSVFYNETDGAVDEVDVENAWGYAFQGGVDFQIPKSRWVVNLDAKKIFLSPNAKVNGGDIESDNFDLDPWVFGVGFGYRF